MDTMDIYEKMRKISEENPEKFDEERIKIIQEFMDKTPEKYKKKIEQLQWKIDSIRKVSKNSLDATVKISELMWKLYMGDDGLVDNLEGLAESLDPNYERKIPKSRLVSTFRPSKKAKVLQIKQLTR